MSVLIAKEFHWEMGHRLSYHTEGCQNLHGHSYRAIIELEGEPDEGGMVLDFGDLAKIVRPILAEIDHSMMLWQEDKEVIEFLTSQQMKVTRVPFHPTAENISRWLLKQLTAHLKSRQNIALVRIRLYETASSVAVVEEKL
ncbi:6-carboxytetrahydropterin synthase [Kamptonema cortianum]|nr:6-carboxytetrahydropterin synthase [Geitlerinema splendidum]MDK3158322.1 6-carboxytetrahydropterin synthase [Kamptonema cortianum]